MLMCQISASAASLSLFRLLSFSDISDSDIYIHKEQKIKLKPFEN